MTDPQLSSIYSALSAILALLTADEDASDERRLRIRENARSMAMELHEEAFDLLTKHTEVNPH